jgi:lipopolysaccharide export system protein LptA
MRLIWFYVIVLALSAPAIAAAQAQRPGGVAPPQLANPAQGILNDNQDQPIQIDAATLEVRDKEKMATFAGDVQVVQGDTTIKCQKLVVFYGPEPGAAANASQAKRQQQQQQPQQPQVQAQQQPQQQQPQQQPHQAGMMPTRQQDIRRIEARGGVTVISKDQTASGDLGVYDLKTKTITLLHNVTVAQGKNVLHGERVVVDTVSGNAHFDSNTDAQNGTSSAKPPGRVRAVILPNKDAKGGGPANTMSIGPGPAKPN